MDNQATLEVSQPFDASTNPSHAADELQEVLRVRARATDVLGSEQKADRWLRKPNMALRDLSPLELMTFDRECGPARVYQVLGQIEHGIY